MKKFRPVVFPFLTCCLTLLLLTSQARAQTTTAYQQTHNGTGTLIASSRTSAEIGSDFDSNVWENFTLGSASEITGITWRGGFLPERTPAETIVRFDISFYASTAANEPGSVPLTTFYATTISPTSAGSFGGVAMFDYSYSLSTPLQLSGSTMYWVQIQAVQLGTPDWGLAVGTGGNNNHWGKIDTGGTISYGWVGGDTSFAMSAVPEPETYALFAAAGVLGFAFRHRSRRPVARK